MGGAKGAAGALAGDAELDAEMDADMEGFAFEDEDEEEELGAHCVHACVSSCVRAYGFVARSMRVAAAVPLSCMHACMGAGRMWKPNKALPRWRTAARGPIPNPRRDHRHHAAALGAEGARRIRTCDHPPLYCMYTCRQRLPAGDVHVL